MKKKNPKKGQSLKSLLIFHIINLIIIIAVLSFIYFFQSKGLIINKNFRPISIITLIIYWLILWIIDLVYMSKYKEYEKQICISSIITSLSLILVGMLLFSFKNNNDIARFLPNAKVTTGTVTKVEQNIEFYKDNCGVFYIRHGSRCDAIVDGLVDGWAHDYYYVWYKYYIDYHVNNNNYEMQFEEYQHYHKYETEAEAKAKSKSMYNNKDKITVYYNVNNPSESRVNVDVMSKPVMIIISSIATALQLLGVFIIYKIYKKD